MLWLQDLGHRFPLCKEKRNENGKGQRCDDLAGEEIDPEDAREPVRIERHDPVDGGKGRQQTVEPQTRGRNHLQPSNESGIAGRVLFER